MVHRTQPTKAHETELCQHALMYLHYYFPPHLHDYIYKSTLLVELSRPCGYKKNMSISCAIVLKNSLPGRTKRCQEEAMMLTLKRT